jgi:(1->4)-alpha-D-glucan 1-alpha-D-glucosylmutase
MASRIPLATYRLQFNSNFRFRDAIPILDYLRDLGISHIYASPILVSRHGSGHGYDVTDPASIDQDSGGADGFAALQSEIEARGLGLLLDIVPNHMAASSENRWWMDVLEYGPDSAFSSYFDIDWRSPSRTLEGKLLLPFLGRPFGEVLNDGELKISLQDGRFYLHYWEQTFPMSPASYAEILSQCRLDAQAVRESGSGVLLEWQGVLAIAHSLAYGDGSTAQAAAERRTRFETMRERLRQLLAASPEIGACIEGALACVNGTPGSPGSFCKLEEILAIQHYRLAFWQAPSEAINYRRFFSIADLVGVRVEDQPVFDATHELAIRTAQSACCAGLRIDHIDGLRDPLGYLNRLRERLSVSGHGPLAERREPYLIVEKILARDEGLPPDWPVEGTTGYDFMNFATRLFVDEQQVEKLNDFYANWTGMHVDFDDVVYEKKKLVMRTLLGVEIRALGRQLGELARDDRYARELHPAELAEALIEVTAGLSIYRTYIRTLDVADAAKRRLFEAIDAARIRRSMLPAAYFDFLAEVLLLSPLDHVRPGQLEARLAFVTRWQQFTGSIMAKGLEDTALYVYFPLSSLNEVGGDPRVTCDDPWTFHRFVAARQKEWPNSLNATTTHDTKRSEDTRARISVLSEIPERWAECLQTWSRMNQKFARQVDGAMVPDRNQEYLIYQTLIGAWPLEEDEWPGFVPRLQEYFIKASREANVHTRWVAPNQAHESALRDYVASALNRNQNPEFVASFEQFQKGVALYGMLNGLSQTLLKATCPGVPDCYQGSELWDLRLVDPDNRGQINFDKRRDALTGWHDVLRLHQQPDLERLLARWHDGRVKLHVLARALNARRANPELFCAGTYEPLLVGGEHARRVVGFARTHKGDWAISMFPRCIASVEGPVLHRDCRRNFWSRTQVSLPSTAPNRWVNILACDAKPIAATSTSVLNLSDIFENFPLALLLPSPPRKSDWLKNSLGTPDLQYFHTSPCCDLQNCVRA